MRTRTAVAHVRAERTEQFENAVNHELGIIEDIMAGGRIIAIAYQDMKLQYSALITYTYEDEEADDAPANNADRTANLE